MPSKTEMSHVGITVSDIEASLRFYTEGLGFELEGDFVGSDDFAPVLEQEEFEAHPHFLTNGRQRIELVHYLRPQAEKVDGRRPTHLTGFTHMAFWVDDVDEVSERLADLGGTVLEHTRTVNDQPDGTPRTYLVCTDPDGVVRIELITGSMPGA